MRIAGIHRATCMVLALLALQSGCGGRLPFDAAAVTGTVTYQGKPLDHGKVIFVPEQGTPGPDAVGLIQSDGSFEMYSGSTPGVAAGKHRVTVHCPSKLTPEQMAAMALPKPLIPETYGRVDTTPLTCELKKGEKREFNITLE
jgi:hypothetical protein